MPKYNYITYWCTECGKTISNVDCGPQSVHAYCPNCETKRPVLFVNDKEVLIHIFNEERMRNTRILCELMGLRYEDVIDKGGIHIVMAEWANEQHKKRFG